MCSGAIREVAPKVRGGLREGDVHRSPATEGAGSAPFLFEHGGISPPVSDKLKSPEGNLIRGGMISLLPSEVSPSRVPGFSRRDGCICLALSIVIVAILSACPASTAAGTPEAWTVTGPSFLSGQLTNLSLSSDGALQLGPMHPPTNRTMILDVGSYGSADSGFARWPFVLKESDGSYKMWYSGYDGSQNRILFATSVDGVHWVKHGVSLDVGVPPYYFNSVASQSVIKVGATYHMWFQGGFWSGGPFGFWAQIYHATSADGASWTITGVALPPNQPWDLGMTNNPWVVQDSLGKYWMYFFGWDGTSTRIGVATSMNGTSFVPYSGNPILDLGPAGSWDGRSLQSPSVHLNGSEWTMYYEGSDGSVVRIGRATSGDGFNWTKSSSNPRLGPEMQGTWDDQSVATPDLFTDASGQRLYYSGSDGANIRIGLYSFVPPPAVQYKGEYISPVFDSGANGTRWISIAWNRSAPAGTSVRFDARAGNSSVPNVDWTAWASLGDSDLGVSLSMPRTRFFQFRTEFSSSNYTLVPSVGFVTTSYARNEGPVAIPIAPTTGIWIGSARPVLSWGETDSEGDSAVAFLVEVSANSNFSTPFVESGILSSNTTSWQVAWSLSDGTWFWRVRAQDAYGAWGNWSSGLFRVDTLAPSLFVTNPLPDTLLHTASTSVTWTALDAGSGLDHIEVAVDSGAPVSVPMENTSLVLSGLSDGTHVISVKAVDRAGNVQVVNLAVRVDTNLFSATGPFGPWPLVATIGAVVAVAGVAGLLLLLRRLRRKPEAP